MLRKERFLVVNLVLILSVLLIISSCDNSLDSSDIQEGNEDLQINQLEEAKLVEINSGVSGLDQNGELVSGIIISSESDSIATNEYEGGITLANPLPNNVRVKLEKEGFVPKILSLSQGQVSLSLSLTKIEESYLVGPGGGRINFSDGTVLEIPEGALEEYTEITYSLLDSKSSPALDLGENYAYAKSMFFGPSGLRFNVPVTVKTPIKEIAEELNYTDGYELELFSFDYSSLVWNNVGNARVENNTLIFEISHFSDIIPIDKNTRLKKESERGPTTDQNGDGKDDLEDDPIALFFLPCNTKETFKVESEKTRTITSSLEGSLSLGPLELSGEREEESSTTNTVTETFEEGPEPKDMWVSIFGKYKITTYIVEKDYFGNGNWVPVKRIKKMELLNFQDKREMGEFCTEDGTYRDPPLSGGKPELNEGDMYWEPWDWMPSGRSGGPNSDSNVIYFWKGNNFIDEQIFGKSLHRMRWENIGVKKGDTPKDFDLDCGTGSITVAMKESKKHSLSLGGGAQLEIEKLALKLGGKVTGKDEITFSKEHEYALERDPCKKFKYQIYPIYHEKWLYIEKLEKVDPGRARGQHGWKILKKVKLEIPIGFYVSKKITGTCACSGSSNNVDGTSRGNVDGSGSSSSSGSSYSTPDSGGSSTPTYKDACYPSEGRLEYCVDIDADGKIDVLGTPLSGQYEYDVVYSYQESTIGFFEEGDNYYYAYYLS